MARAYEEINKSKAIEIYTDVLNSLKFINHLTVFNEVNLKHKIAQLFERMGNYKSSLKYCDEILALKNIPQKQFERLEERLERVKEQRIKLIELINR